VLAGDCRLRHLLQPETGAASAEVTDCRHGHRAPACRLEVEMSTSNWILLLTSISAAIVALIGFLLNQVALRNERRSRVYAEALSAVFEFQELPYRIRKRAASEDSSAMIAQKSVTYSYAWTSIERCCFSSHRRSGTHTPIWFARRRHKETAIALMRGNIQ
jgi:hypothetical protein